MRAAARGAGPTPYAEVFYLFVLIATISTGLAAGKESRYLHHNSAGPCGFVLQLPEEFTPGDIRNTFCQMVVSQHPLHIEVLHTNDLVLIHQRGGQLMKHVIAAVAHLLMATGNLDSLLFPVGGTMLPSGQLTLFTPQPDFRFPQILWVLVFLPIAVNGKGFEANVQSNHGVDTRFRLNLHLAKNRHKILSAGRTANGGIANLAFDITALAVWHPSQTRQFNSLV